VSHIFLSALHAAASRRGECRRAQYLVDGVEKLTSVTSIAITRATPIPPMEDTLGTALILLLSRSWISDLSGKRKKL
jgi:hypothetical protein